jgi:hypothetical protein
MRLFRRFLVSVLIGILITPLAGYFGALFVGVGVFPVWLGTLFFSLFTVPKLGVVLLVAPALYGAKIAWPITVVLFPLTSLVCRHWSNAALFVVGAISGSLLVHLEFLWRILGPPQDHLAFVIAGGFAGAALGVIFSLTLRRYDRRYPIDAG